MAEKLEAHMYAPRDLVTSLLKDKGIHEGHWMLLVKFGFSAMNVGTTESGDDSCPAGVVAVRELGIQRIARPQLSSVDASIANPKRKATAALKAKPDTSTVAPARARKTPSKA